MSDSRIAFLGAGNMGRALVGGLLRSGRRPELLSVGERLPEARAALASELGISALADNREAIAGAGVVVLAVKPQEARATLTALAPQLSTERPLVISVAAGVRTPALESWCGPGVPVVRAMPNRPALIGAGVSGLYAPPGVGAGTRAVAEQLLRSVGEVCWVSVEEALDVVTAVSGSGPAYFFLLAELMAEAGEDLGLARETARRLATATLYGAGLMVQSGDRDPGRLRGEVSSPGGTTEAALSTFEAAGLREIVRRALGAAMQRSRELAAASPR